MLVQLNSPSGSQPALSSVCVSTLDIQEQNSSSLGLQLFLMPTRAFPPCAISAGVLKEIGEGRALLQVCDRQLSLNCNQIKYLQE